MKSDSTVANGRTFLVTDEDGRPTRAHDGLYHDDVRHLQTYELSVERTLETIEVTHPRPGERVVHAGSEIDVGSRSLHVTRRQLVTDGFCERIEVTNLERDPLDERLTFDLEAGFEDLFEIRGHAEGPDRALETTANDDGVTFAYDPDDMEYERATTVRIAGGDALSVGDVDGASATLAVEASIGPGETSVFTVAVSPADRAEAPADAYDRAAEQVRERERAWYDRTTLPPGERSAADAILERSRRDLLSLTMNTEYGPLFTAGTPWFATAFGRDSLLAAYQALPMTAEPAAATLRYLADYQATEVDEFRAAAPGKILHELRRGELTVRGDVPHSPYYGTIDATALFVVLLHEIWSRTDDDELLEDLWENLEAALEWLETYGDADSDGFLEYPTEGHEGLTHRAWKDSNDGIVHPDGSHPTGPLAVAEVQGYYYDALSRAAALYRHRGETEAASDLDARATDLAARFDEAFWLPEESFYAVALDGDGDPIESVTTNPGQCLWSGIVPPERADEVIDRLVADDMFSGWGIRTLSSDHDAYNPQSYHLGSVWPHDTSLVVLGMANYGRLDAAKTVTEGLIDGATERGNDRLPELFAGFDRERSSLPIEYGEACEPQAWAAGAPLACIGAIEGAYDLEHVEGIPTQAR
jgi:glycogen debranching enzyme